MDEFWLNTDLNKYLPIAGGSMTGDVYMNGKSVRTVNDIEFSNGSWLKNLLKSKQDTSTAINTDNIGNQSVNYANSAGSTQVAGYITDGTYTYTPSGIYTGFRQVSKGTLSLISNSIVTGLDIKWKAKAGVIWVSGQFSISNELSANGSTFFADGLPSNITKQILAVAQIVTGPASPTTHRENVYLYAEGKKLTVYNGGNFPCQCGTYVFSGVCIMD